MADLEQGLTAARVAGLRLLVCPLGHHPTEPPAPVTGRGGGPAPMVLQIPAALLCLLCNGTGEDRTGPGLVAAILDDCDRRGWRLTVFWEASCRRFEAHVQGPQSGLRWGILGRDGGETREEAALRAWTRAVEGRDA